MDRKHSEVKKFSAIKNRKRLDELHSLATCSRSYIFREWFTVVSPYNKNVLAVGHKDREIRSNDDTQ